MLKLLPIIFVSLIATSIIFVWVAVISMAKVALEQPMTHSVVLNMTGNEKCYEQFVNSLDEGRRLQLEFK